MTWVRFHEQLCADEKTGISRATRFVYMELSLRARARRGYIVIPQGMTDVKAVQLMLSGNPREVAEALKTLTAEPDPMVRFADIDGKRAIVVVKWEVWNPTRDDSRERVRRFRDRSGGDTDTPDGDPCNALHGVTETPESSDGHALHRGREEVLARPRALISSPLLSGSSLVPEGDRKIATAPPGALFALGEPSVPRDAEDRHRSVLDAWIHARELRYPRTKGHRPQLDPARRQAVDAALKLGYSVDQLRQAVAGEILNADKDRSDTRTFIWALQDASAIDANIERWLLVHPESSTRLRTAEDAGPLSEAG